MKIYSICIVLIVCVATSSGCSGSAPEKLAERPDRALLPQTNTETKGTPLRPIDYSGAAD
ncbi:hypothetical protein ACFQI7_19985 [Paenibacillus allorhizosphaerae]|uniref:hypothetical protein n=1 Tax=Paenibacillus allorhizosphaerae TaxID=2849866 RepID=UPI001C407A62|nr:hypothetical protein [Paenibacillus allorhizosphaerae]